MPPRGILPRIPFLRNLVPRVSTLGKPLLPFTSLVSTSAASNPVFLSASSRAQSSSLFSNIHASLTSRSFSSSPSLASSSSSASNHASDSDLPPSPNQTLSQRLKHLIKSYGWYALGVYFILSAFDFSLAFASINLLGASYVEKLTSSVKQYALAVLPALAHLPSLSSLLPSASPSSGRPAEPGRDEMDSAHSVNDGNGDSGRENLYAMLLLAYTVHKTIFLPFRIGATAAVTPRLVGWLRTRGWAGGEGARRAAREMSERVRGGRGLD